MWANEQRRELALAVVTHLNFQNEEWNYVHSEYYCVVFFFLFLFRSSEVSAELPTLLTGGSLSYLRSKKAHALVWTAKSVSATYRLIARVFCE